MLPLLLQSADHVFKGQALAVDTRFRLFNNIRVQPQPLGNGEGVGFARNAEYQLVGGLQRGHVKFTGGVFHPFGLQSIGFQLGIVGGGGHQRPLLPQALDNRRGQGGALHWVCAGAQLVHQRQTAWAGLRQNFHNGLHMRGKGGKRLLDALLVANIRQHAAAHLNHAVLSAGNLQAALGHQRQQTQGLQAYCLAAGVGAGDNHRVGLAADGEIDGHGGILGQQRMPSPLQLGSRLRPSQPRTQGLHLISQLGFGKDKI